MKALPSQHVAELIDICREADEFFGTEDRVGDESGYRYLMGAKQ